MLTEFIHKTLSRAKYELLSDGTFYAEIPGIRGVWANEKNLEKTRQTLSEVFEEWLLLKVKHGEKITGFTFGQKSKSPVHA